MTTNTKARMTSKGNVKLTLTKLEAEQLRAILGHSNGNMLIEVHHALSNLTYGGRIRHINVSNLIPPIDLLSIESAFL